MDDNFDIPEESMQHIEALLARHPPHLIQRMFSQAMGSRRSSVAASFMSTSTTSSRTTASSASSWRSRMSIASTTSTASVDSHSTPSIASSPSSQSRVRRTEPRSYPATLDPSRAAFSTADAAALASSPLELKMEPGLTDINPLSPYGHDRSPAISAEPFMFCTYCAEQKLQKTFKAKSDWKKHEMRMHETGENWSCIVLGCQRVFDRQKDFIKHHQRHHSGRPLPSLTDIGITLLPRRIFGCGFNKCKEVSIGWDERCDHVAKHMKNGATADQWRYSNVIRNLIRQEALHDTWKELLACLDERLRESRSQISWCPDNTRTLRQKLQCCDLRPSREEVLITALSLRSDIPLDVVHQQLPPGFVVPSRDSVPQVDKLTREQRMHVLIGNAHMPLSQTRLAAINAALLISSNSMPNTSDYDTRASPFVEPSSPVVDSANRRISYMDVDTGSYMDVAQPAIPDSAQAMAAPDISLPHSRHPPVPDPAPATQPHEDGYNESKPAGNPLGWYYPSYFDAAPQFEETPYYERPAFEPISKSMPKTESRLGGPRSDSVHARAVPGMNTAPKDMASEYAMMNPPPLASQRPQPPPPIRPIQLSQPLQQSPLIPLTPQTPQTPASPHAQAQSQIPSSYIPPHHHSISLHSDHHHHHHHHHSSLYRNFTHMHQPSFI